MDVFSTNNKSLAVCCFFSQPPAAQSFATHVVSSKDTTTSSLPVCPIASGGPFYYCNPPTLAAPFMTTLPAPVSSVSSSNPNTYHLPTASTVLPQQIETSVSLNDFVQLVASTKYYHLIEWKHAEKNTNSLEYHE